MKYSVQNVQFSLYARQNYTLNCICRYSVRNFWRVCWVKYYHINIMKLPLILCWVDSQSYIFGCSGLLIDEYFLPSVNEIKYLLAVWPTENNMCDQTHAFLIFVHFKVTYSQVQPVRFQFFHFLTYWSGILVYALSCALFYYAFLCMQTWAVYS